jgi:hypothetical protein
MFSKYFPNYEKLKSFVESFTPNNQILIFDEQVMYVQYGFLHLILTRAKLTVHRRGLTWDLGRDSRDLRHLLSIPKNIYCKMNKVSRSTIKTHDNKTVFIFKNKFLF